jgi:methylmalonyl-CoA mutase N-terminal domain/subunit
MATDPADGAYVVSYTKEQLQATPSGSIDELTQDGGTLGAAVGGRVELQTTTTRPRTPATLRSR